MTLEQLSRAARWLHARGVEVTRSQVLAAEYLWQDLLVRRVRAMGHDAPSSDRELLERIA